MRGETKLGLAKDYALRISIHSPHARGDHVARNRQPQHSHFNPLPSCEGRPRNRSQANRHHQISIHSPHARGDAQIHFLSASVEDFNPLPSCEGRPIARNKTISSAHFNPLPSCEGRRHTVRDMVLSMDISIHSPHARGDGAKRNRVCR